MKANEFFKAMGLKAVKQFLENDNIRTKEMSDELKRLVESHELVEECGGLDKAKERVALEEKSPNPNVFYVLVVSGAIDDVESCQ